MQQSRGWGLLIRILAAAAAPQQRCAATHCHLRSVPDASWLVSQLSRGPRVVLPQVFVQGNITSARPCVQVTGIPDLPD